MARPLRLEYPGATYHVMNRGNAGLKTFSKEIDYLTFIDKLGSLSEDFRVDIRAFCLMENHFHLYISTPEGNLSRFMQSLLTSYTVTKNRRDRRSGHLFQGRFKSIVVEDELYGSEVSRYLHLNPVNLRKYKNVDITVKQEHIREYSWSSYAMIIGLKTCPNWLKINATLCRWGDKLREQQNNYATYVEEGLLKKINDPMAVAAARMILGSEGFVDGLRRGLTAVSEKINIKREHSQENQLRSWVSLDDLISTIGKTFTIERDQLLQCYNRGCYARQVAMYLAARYCRGRYSLTQISAYFNLSVSGLGSARTKFSARLAKSPELRKRVAKIEEELTLKTQS